VKYFLFNYQRHNVPAYVFELPYIEEVSLKVLTYVAEKNVNSLAQMPGLPLVLTAEVRKVMPEDVAKLYSKTAVKGTCYYKLLSLYDDIYKVGMKDEYETRTEQVAW